jgi:hypothetical protein
MDGPIGSAGRIGPIGTASGLLDPIAWLPSD